MGKLTDVKIASANASAKAFRLADGSSLFLEVRPTGQKIWLYRFRIASKPNIYTIGRYFPGRRKPADHVSLEAAREERDKARKLVRVGINPNRERQAKRLLNQAAAQNTFEAIAKEWIEQTKGRWTPGYLAQVESMLKADVYPHIAKLPIRSVTAAHLLEILRIIDKRGAKTVATLVRQWCSAIFRFAVTTGRADYDLAAALKGFIRRNKVRHKTPLSRDEIADLLEKVDKSAYRTTAIALRLLLYTFVRPGELRNSRWSEFDLERREWRIPAERMKMREMHVVPLSDQAYLLLEELRKITGASMFLFPNFRRPQTVMTITTLNRALERMGYGGKFSAHGFRATASTFLHELGFRTDFIERQLAHAERNKSRASYNQAEYLVDRREMMQSWADFVDATMNRVEVIPIRSAQATAGARR